MIQINIKHNYILPNFISFNKQMLLFITIEDDTQKQPFTGVLKKIHNIHKKTPLLRTAFFLIENLQWLFVEIFIIF